MDKSKATGPHSELFNGRSIIYALLKTVCLPKSLVFICQIMNYKRK